MTQTRRVINMAKILSVIGSISQIRLDLSLIYSELGKARRYLGIFIDIYRK